MRNPFNGWFLVKLIAICTAIWLGFATLLPSAVLAERSPVFGGATVEAISREAARDVTARGEFANAWGSLAASYAYNAYVFAFYARHFSVPNSVQEQNWYATAAWYAYHAYLFSVWAWSYSQSGM